MFKNKIKSSQIQAIFPEYRLSMKGNNVPIVRLFKNRFQLFVRSGLLGCRCVVHNQNSSKVILIVYRQALIKNPLLHGNKKKETDTETEKLISEDFMIVVRNNSCILQSLPSNYFKGLSLSLMKFSLSKILGFSVQYQF